MNKKNRIYFKNVKLNVNELKKMLLSKKKKQKNIILHD